MTAVNDWMGDVWRISADAETTASVTMPTDTDAIGSFESTVVHALVDTAQGIGVILDDTHLLLIRPTSGRDVDVSLGIAHWVEIPYGISAVRLRIRWDGTDVVMEYSLNDGFDWVNVDTFDQLDDPLGCLLYYSHIDGRPAEASVFYQTRALNGVIDATAAAVSQTIAAPTPPAVSVGNPTQTAEPIVHALVAAQFGDLEFDTGTSVRWTQWFTNDVFITDVNDGNQRFWVVDWDKTFPTVHSTVTSLNFFNDPVAFRKRQFSDAQAFATRYPDQYTLADDDWVLFVDSHEGLSADTSSPPTNVSIQPFHSYIAREVTRAGSNTSVSIPFFAYVRHDHVQNVSYTETTLGGVTLTAEQAAGVPYYIARQGLVRLVKMSALKNPSFDWTKIDQPSAAASGVKIQVVSYGYAHWQPLDVPVGQSTVPPLDANNDLGWRQRCLLSQVRPITGLPFGNPNNPVGTWQNPSADAAGLPGPWLPDVYADRDVDFNVPTTPPASDPSMAGILVPLYDSVLRLNLRDGLWYDNADGNTPVIYDDATGKWLPVVAA